MTWSYRLYLLDSPSPRWVSTAVAVPSSGLYLLGGLDTETSSSFLSTGSTEWVAGPEIPGGGAVWACGVPVGETAFLLLGGFPHYT